MTNDKSTNKASDKKAKQKRLGGIAAFSLLISLFDRLGEIIYDAFINGFFGRIFTSHTKLRNKFSNGFFSVYVLNNDKIKNFFRKIHRFWARNLESCLTVSLVDKAVAKCCSFPLQYYGNFGAFFGVYTIIIYCIKYFVPWLAPAPTSQLWTGISVLVASFPLCFSRISLATSVKNSVFGRALFKDTFGFSDESFDSKKNTSFANGLWMFFFGFATSVITLFIHPIYVIIAMATVVFITLIAYTPEIGVLLTIVLIPFLSLTPIPTISLLILIIITAFFYLIKILRGKRVFKLETLDFAVLLFGVLILLSSFYSAGGQSSVRSAWVCFILLLGYFLFVNLMRTEKWVKRCIVALVASASVVAFIGVFEFIFGKENTNWLDQSFYGSIKTRVVSLFENPNMLAIFLVMAFPFLLALAIKAKEKNEKFLSKMLIALFIACIIFTWSRAAWIAIILEVLVFAILVTKKSFRIFGVALITLPLVPIILPENIIDRFLSISNLSDSSIAYRIYTWKGTLRAIKDYLFCGIGYGDSAFQTVYPEYSYAGIETTPHSHSLVLQLLLCMGIVGFTVFCIAIFLSYQKNFEFIKNEKNTNSSIYVIATVVSVTAALTMGIFDFIWYNPRMFYLFWIIIAIGASVVRIGDYERSRLEDFEHYQN